MKPEVAVFTKQNPCTKLHIWNCFAGARGRFRKVVKAEAQSIIGANAPKNMLNNNYMVEQRDTSADYYVLTDAGKDWLTKGIIGYLKNHPSDVSQARNLTKSITSQL